MRGKRAFHQFALALEALSWLVALARIAIDSQRETVTRILRLQTGDKGHVSTRRRLFRLWFVALVVKSLSLLAQRLKLAFR